MIDTETEILILSILSVQLIYSLLITLYLFFYNRCLGQLKLMRDYVVYHKAEKMGYPALDIDNLAIYTKKPTDGTKGNRIWLIAGEGSPRKYFLRATFIINSVEPSDKPEFTTRVTGTDGQLLDPMPRLNSERWFAGFVEEQGRFAFGFNRINNDVAIEALRRILLENTLR